MKKTLLILSLVLFSFCALASKPTEEEDGVVILTDKNFDEFISSHEYVLVEFYAPWCGHCKKLAPEYSQAAQQLSQHTPYVPLAKVDATSEKEVASRYNIMGYPTLKFFIKGQPIEYQGGRTGQDMVDWVRKKTGPSSHHVNDSDFMLDLIGKNKVTVVYFGKSAEDPEFIVFDQVSKQYDEVVFGHTFSEEVTKNYDIKGNGIVLFKMFDEGRVDFKATDTSVESLIRFIEENQQPLIMEFDEKSAQKIFGDLQPVIFLLIGQDAASQEARKAFDDAASLLKGKILLSYANAKEGLGNRLAEFLGIGDNELPTVRIVVPTDEDVQKFTLQGTITKDNIINFVNEWKDKKLKPFYKSEEPPENNDQPVKVVVGKTFKEIVSDESKDVLVEFYAPWCGHCKELAPVYEKLARELQSNPNIVIAKIDSTANEIDGVPINGFPTIKFFPANNKQNPIDYNDERTEEGFIKFLKEHATLPWVEASGKEHSDL